MGEEETGLAGQSNRPQEHQLKPFVRKDARFLHRGGKKKIRQGKIITVVRCDEATVPDWNINVRMEEEKKGECVYVCVC